MKLLEKENWWIWLMLAFLSGGSSVLVLGALLDIYEKDAWYYRWVKKLPKVVNIILLVMICFSGLASTFAFSFMLSTDFAKFPILFGTILSILAFIYFIISVLLMVFQIQILASVNAQLKTPGSELYLSPYIWILGLIIPIIGWIMLIVMTLYLQIWYLVMLYRGNGTMKASVK